MEISLQKRFFSAGTAYADFDRHIPAPALRHTFQLAKGATGRLLLCAPGFYDLYLNGTRLTRGELAPYIANPDHLLYCDEYDVSAWLQEGENVIGLLLGNGVINPIGGGVWDFDKADYRAAPCVALRFVAQSGGGMVDFDASVFRWQNSPILFNDLRCGEWYDAEQDLGAWLLPGYDDSDWHPVTPAPSPRGNWRRGTYAPIEVTATRAPVSVRRSHIGIYPDLGVDATPPDDREESGYLYDFGINSAGVCRLQIRHARKGQRIVLQFAEILGEKKADGRTRRDDTCGVDLRGIHFLPHRYNNRDVYICRGDAVEEWTPRFTYHGFRYCFVYGIREEQATPDLLTYLEMHTALPTRATLETSSDMVNRIWEATRRSDLANFYHFPTDCPQREKNGWTGDVVLSAEQMLLLFRAEDNLAEWLAGIRCAQFPDGSFPGIVPTNGWGRGNGPTYDGVIIELPYRIYAHTGDTQIIRDNLHAMFRYLQHMDSTRNEDGLIAYGLGDWCQAARAYVNRPTAPAVVTSTLFAMDLARKAAVLCSAVGAELQAAYARSLSDALRSAARKHFLRADGVTMTARTQTAQAAALHYGLFEPGEQPAAFRVLLQLIDENNGSFDCGTQGLRVIFRVLSRFGETERALRMITKPAFPSYGYWMKHGATSLWELMAPIAGTQSSCNHHFFGDVAAWFVETLAGIQLNPDGRDPDRVLIAPQFVEHPAAVRATVQARTGAITVDWQRQEDCIDGDITVPDGMKATLLLDAGWKSEDGFTVLPIVGHLHLRVIRANAPDRHRRTD